MNLCELNLTQPKTFVSTSGKLRVTDPCYSPTVWCSGEIGPTMIGTWNARVSHFRDPFEIEHSQNAIETMKKESQERIDEMKRSLGKLVKGGEASDVASRFELHERERIGAAIERNNAYKGRVALLHIIHESQGSAEPTIDLSTFEEVVGLDVGVDSGQAGFFDLARYSALWDGNKELPTQSSFYSQVCGLTYNEKAIGHEQFGTLEFGVASSSGYGDGGYTCFVRRNEEGVIFEAMIVFISGDDDE